MSVDEVAAFVGSVPYRETRLPWGAAQVWDMGEGRPVVMLHGIAGGRRLFYRAAPILASSRRVVVPPLRGEGVPDDARTVETYLDDITALLRELDLRDVTLLGVSFGAYLALAFAARGDPRVTAVVAQGGFGVFHLRLFDRIALALSRLGPDAWGSAYFKRRVLKGRELAMLQEHVPGLETLVADWMGKTPFSSLRARTYMIASQAVTGAIGIPMTLAHGRFDSVVPFSCFERLCELYPDATQVAWDDAGHNVMLTHPERLAGLLA